MNGVANEALQGFRHATTAVRDWAVFADARMTPLTVAAFVLLAGICMAIAAVTVLNRRNDDLDEMLRPYRLLPAAESPDAFRAVRPIVRRIGERLLALVEARGLRPALELRLQRSGLPTTSGEFLVIWAVTLFGAAVVGTLLGHVLGAIFGLLIGALGPHVVLTMRCERRQRAFGAQLPDVLKLLASSLRAGFSLLQCLGAVTEQSADPMQSELRGAMARIRLGEPVEDALADVAERIGSRDFHWTVLAIRIQREVGGNLAEILDTVAETMVERERIRREVRTLTAEGRASAIILAALPVALAMFIYVANRAYLDVMLTSTSGQIAILVGVVMELVGGWWMHRTIQIEV